jgi:hypothetical protein
LIILWEKIIFLLDTALLFLGYELTLHLYHFADQFLFFTHGLCPRNVGNKFSGVWVIQSG